MTCCLPSPESLSSSVPARSKSAFLSWRLDVERHVGRGEQRRDKIHCFTGRRALSGRAD